MSSVKEIKVQVHEKLVETGEYDRYVHHNTNSFASLRLRHLF
jgi:hypothetical protein